MSAKIPPSVEPFSNAIFDGFRSDLKAFHKDDTEGIYYDSSRGKYYAQTDSGDYVLQNEIGVKRRLKAKGLNPYAEEKVDLVQLTKLFSTSRIIIVFSM